MCGIQTLRFLVYNFPFHELSSQYEKEKVFLFFENDKNDFDKNDTLSLL